jgi:glycosyltransferase involved in cell wall biosynthesis
VRIAVLMTGLTAYQDTCFQALSELGDDLLLVHPESMAYAPFDKSKFTNSVKRHIWKTMPDAKTLVPIVEEFKPDAVIMWSWDGRGYRAVMKAVKGRALRVMFSSNFWRGTKKQYAGLVASRFYVTPLFESVWVPSAWAESFAKLIGFDGKDIIRGANSADTAVFDRGPREAEEIAKRRRFVFTGRLIWHKAPTELAEAYRRYRAATEAPWDLDVVGAGPLAKDFDGIDGVTLRGFMQPEELSDLMHEASCLILPSHAEWYGVVVHEAAVAGLPIICSDGVGAVPHLLQDNFNGWAFPAGNVDAMAQAMGRMSALSVERLKAMSDGSRALGSRLTPQIWARNLHEEIERRLVTKRG